VPIGWEADFQSRTGQVKQVLLKFWPLFMYILGKIYFSAGTGGKCEFILSHIFMFRDTDKWHF
jgi:hypothetical protein